MVSLNSAALSGNKFSSLILNPINVVLYDLVAPNVKAISAVKTRMGCLGTPEWFLYVYRTTLSFKFSHPRLNISHENICSLSARLLSFQET